MLHVVEKLPLRELLVDFRDLFEYPTGTFPNIDPTLPMFRELTPEECPFTTQFPALTHLSLKTPEEGGALLAWILAHCPKLRVLIGIFWTHWNSAYYGPADFASLLLARENWYQSPGDPRLVLMGITDTDAGIADWQAGARGESDMWARAERFIAKRRRGEIQPASRCWIEDSYSIQ
ncbi:hypothetical protein C8J57DRAFT_1237826 [Mycena rebaudengoi]|nr:hypothetical protein C8J57DRAFT_1237826 [Mycena rebaudengoi]